MKLLELSSLQRLSLFEMCFTLFPEYKSIDFVGTCDFCIDGTMRFSKYENPEEHWNDWTLIHWYEFAITHLSNAILSKDPKNQKLDYEFHMNNATSWWESHPIDYLYGQFKLLQI